MEGHGPVTTAQVRHVVEHLASQVEVQPVIDLNRGAAVDAFEIPQRRREAVHLIHPCDVFPFAANLTKLAIPWVCGHLSGNGGTGELGNAEAKAE